MSGVPAAPGDWARAGPWASGRCPVDAPVLAGFCPPATWARGRRRDRGLKAGGSWTGPAGLAMSFRPRLYGGRRPAPFPRGSGRRREGQALCAPRPRSPNPVPSYGPGGRGWVRRPRAGGATSGVAGVPDGSPARRPSAVGSGAPRRHPTGPWGGAGPRESAVV